TTRRFEEIKKDNPVEDMCVLFVNLQNFKYINETAGAKAGDEAIIQFARKALNFVDRSCESCCRLGGDNFVMVVQKRNLETILDKLHSVKIENLENAPNQTFKISCWVGISETRPGQEHEPFVVRLNEAAAACNIGKTRLKRSLVRFDDELVKMVGQSRRIIAIFKPAIKNHEFHPFFQAKVDMNTGKLVGFEALCRWIHEGSFIYPDQFIPVLDKEGLIHDLDMAIFSETCIAIRKWKDMGLTPPRVSSNFSRKNLYVPDIEDKIYGVIKENGLDSGDVEIEITESVKEADYDRLIEYVKKLKSYGVHISIDDFGTGYSSLSLIHNIDADGIKIDKSFVDEVTGEGKAKILIESIVSIAQRLKMSVIAEGVETAEQGETLLGFGCNYAQGYYYSKPVDYETATEIITNPPFLPINAGAV
ncbi:MAG: EAL domain-containing protein, partial [Lachnospiraceae bacterium]|nr:EAL domain-containing protein [Lachnospiraceae bacterium]